MSETVKGVPLLGGADFDDIDRYGSALAGQAGLVIPAVFVSPAVPEEALDRFLSAVGGSPRLFTGKRPDQDPAFMARLAEDGVDLLINLFFEFRLRAELLAAVRRGAVNIHPAALPNNRGLHSPFWGILDGTPHGATLHWMNEKIDEGDIIDQEAFPDDGVSPAAEVRARTRDLCLAVFERALPGLVAGTAPHRPQGEGGAYHFRHEIAEATTFDAEARVSMDHVARLVRGTDFGPHGFWIKDGERTLFVRGRVYPVSAPGVLPEDDERR